MKEIGEKLKEARESIGVSIEEASTDLKTTSKELTALEDGNMEAFKDVLNLKYLIREYAKYLGLDKEDLVDEFNEYLFDYTSKISLDDINNAKQAQKKEDKKIKSPYTTIKEKKQINYILLSISLIVILGLIVVAIYYVDIKKKKDSNLITYVGGSTYASIN